MADEREREPKAKRRTLLARGGALAMATGLAASYGTCGYICAQYVYPRPGKRVRLFVSDLASIGRGASLAYQLPNGAKVAVTRHGEGGGAADFVALSSRCPHLGCQVHWEAKEARYFCPCHNGTFDAAGQPTGGPPKADGTPLIRYPLFVDAGLLYIEIAEEELA